MLNTTNFEGWFRIRCDCSSVFKILCILFVDKNSKNRIQKKYVHVYPRILTDPVLISSWHNIPTIITISNKHNTFHIRQIWHFPEFQNVLSFPKKIWNVFVSERSIINLPSHFFIQINLLTNWFFFCQDFLFMINFETLRVDWVVNVSRHAVLNIFLH